MIKYLPILAILFLIAACNVKPQQTNDAESPERTIVTRTLSTNVGDSFSTFISLPEGYNPQQAEKYPVVYLLDANFYFDIVAKMMDKYSEVGMQKVILVGIGYQNLQAMDSLRDRDFTFPKALPEVDMKLSGGADKFLAYINQELIPSIDKKYNTDTTNRILMGHSCGGYFTMYSLMQALSGKENHFNTFIAGSPSLHYNHYYLPDQLKQATANAGIKVYVTYGGLEDEEEEDTTLVKNDVLLQQLSQTLAGKVTYKSDLFSNLAHMDTPFPTFSKGVQWVFFKD